MEPDTILTYLDNYCERAGNPGLWAEPLNSFSNLFFFAAAIAAAYLLGKQAAQGNAKRVDFWLLIASLAGIAIGSGLYHLAPRGDTVLMDVIPITLFINIYLVAALRRLFHLPWGKVAAWWGAYFAAGMAAQYLLPEDTLNGTIMYVPTYLTLVIITLALRMRDRALGAPFVTVVLVWTVSLAFRTVDRALCDAIPFGTHFLWHTLNAWVLWRLLDLLMHRAATK